MEQVNVKQHFRADEAPFIDQVNDWLTTAGDQYRPVLTAFLNPRQRYIMRVIANRQDEVKVAFKGAYPGAEMQRGLAYPAYYQPTEDDFELQLLEINYPQKFAELHHRQVMGAVLSTGVERGAFGDIIVSDEHWQIIIQRQLSDYLIEQVTSIGKAKVRLEKRELQGARAPQEDWQELVTTVASLRLDAVVAASFNYSRNRAKQLIERGQVRVNWEEIDRPDYELASRDLISVRHGGRIKVQEELGQNRHERTRIRLAVIHA